MLSFDNIFVHYGELYINSRTEIDEIIGDVVLLQCPLLGISAIDLFIGGVYSLGEAVRVVLYMLSLRTYS